jgi:hypothetical protein
VDIVPGERPVRLAPGRESERLEQKKAVHFERPLSFPTHRLQSIPGT